MGGAADGGGKVWQLILPQRREALECFSRLAASVPQRPQNRDVLLPGPVHRVGSLQPGCEVAS